MSPIHPTAIIDPAAEIHPSAEIGPFVIVDGPVQVGARTVVMAHAHLSGKTVIGEDNQIHMGAVVGHHPQHLAFKGGNESGVQMGDRNVVREYATVHRAYHPGSMTVVGNGNFFMAHSHVGHDSRVGDSVVMANAALLGGHVQVEDMANISGNVSVHQFVRVGRLAMIGGNARVVKDVPPFMLVEGNSEVHGLNSVGLRRAGLDQPTRTIVKQAYRLLYRSGFNVPQALQRIEADAALAASEPVLQMIAFIRNSVRGICRHAPRKTGLPASAEE